MTTDNEDRIETVAVAEAVMFKSIARFFNALTAIVDLARPIAEQAAAEAAFRQRPDATRRTRDRA